MHKKGISFGKITLSAKTSQESDEVSSTSGFGTFGRTPIQEHKEIEEIADDLESQHVHQVMGIKNFGKKAKNFDVEAMVEEAKKSAHEANKRKLAAEAEAENEISTSQADEDDDDDIIGPLPPPKSKEDELIGPPVPSSSQNDLGSKNKAKDSDEDSDDDDDDGGGSDEEELTLEKRIPITHEVTNN